MVSTIGGTPADPSADSEGNINLIKVRTASACCKTMGACCESLHVRADFTAACVRLLIPPHVQDSLHRRMCGAAFTTPNLLGPAAGLII